MRRSSATSAAVLHGALILLSLSSVCSGTRSPKHACPQYANYVQKPHPPYSTGEHKFPSQRPAAECRTFTSTLVEEIISDLNEKLVDKDLAKLFENAFPNTLDTTVAWHVDESPPAPKVDPYADFSFGEDEGWQGAQSFIVTGDINAEWLRDSTNQLAQYQVLAGSDEKIYTLIHGAINTQAEYVIRSPYCNAFQPPPPSGMSPQSNGQTDSVHPFTEPSEVFECKYELDSLAHFLSLGNQFHKHTESTVYLTPRWYTALDTVLSVLDDQTRATFNPRTGRYERNDYTFERQTSTGTETLNLHGIGNPLANGTGLIRSAFRPSDDATIFGFFIPANAMMAVELNRTADVLEKVDKDGLAKILREKSASITQGIYDYGVVDHKVFGRVFAFEVDGYGSHLFMDDANSPSLLALPLLGFVDINDEIYQNTRKMILSRAGNPYYITGSVFSGIGGPHVGLSNAWPLSLLIQAQTTDDADEIRHLLDQVMLVSPLGVVHESVNVNRKTDYSRPWFAWANSVFAQTILDLAKRKPAILFGAGAEPYVVRKSAVEKATAHHVKVAADAVVEAAVDGVREGVVKAADAVKGVEEVLGPGSAGDALRS